MSAASPNDPLAFGRQLWQQWNDALQTAVPSAAPTMPDWTSAMRQWSELAGGGSMDANRAADKLGMHGQQFFSLMQQLVQRASAGAGPTSMPDLTAMWRTQLGDGNPMQDALKQITAEGARGWEQLFEGARSAAKPAIAELLSTLKLPGFGQGRERQAQVGDLIAAQVAQAEAVQVYQHVLQKASQAGMQRFEDKLAEHSEPGRQIGSMRALYDLWIDAAEEAYAQVALSPEFREVYANLVNTQMRAKQLQQKEIERLAAEAGMPTRSELDGVLHRIHDLQRDLRALRNSVAAQGNANTVARAQTKPERPTAAKTSAKPVKAAATPAASKVVQATKASKVVRSKAAPAKAAASKPAPSKPAPSKPAPSKPAPSKPAPSKPAPRKSVESKPAASKSTPAKAEASKSKASKAAISTPITSDVSAPVRQQPVQGSLSAELEQAAVTVAPTVVAVKKAAKRVSKGA